MMRRRQSRVLEGWYDRLDADRVMAYIEANAERSGSPASR